MSRLHETDPLDGTRERNSDPNVQVYVQDGDLPPERSPGVSEMAKVIVAAAMGNSLEWFDFALFAYFNDQIGKHFFPPSESLTRTMESFGVFGSAFFMRPLGGMLFGWIGDKYGRVVAIRMSIFLMAFPTLLVGILPGYNQIGMVSPSLLLLIRLLQGLSVGGEWIGSQVYIFEMAPRRNSGFFCALNGACEFGFLLATGISALLHSVLTPAQLDSWGWRLPFFCGIFVAAVGCWIRKNLHETDQFSQFVAQQQHIQQEQAEAGGSTGPPPPLPQVVARRNPMMEVCNRNTFSQILFVFGGIIQPFISYYMGWVWITVFLSQLRTEPRLTSAFVVNAVAMLFYKAAQVVFGVLGDKVGHSSVMQACSLLLMLLAPPLFRLLDWADPVQAGVIQATLGIIFGMYEANFSVWSLTQLSNVGSRFTAYGLAYNAGAALLGGTTPLLATLLYSKEKWAPGLYVSAAAFISGTVVTVWRVWHFGRWKAFLCRLPASQVHGQTHMAMKIVTNHNKNNNNAASKH